jgi:uncharacterized protein (DUF4415 family)
MAEHQNPRNWPAFVTSDLGDSAADAAEMERRWTVYRDEMAALIAAGGVHQDKDGWWVDDASGELIGPDPEMEKPWTEDMFAHARPFTEAFPPWPKRSGARAAPEGPRKVMTTIRLSPDVVAYFKQTGAGWQARVDQALKDWMATH